MEIWGKADSAPPGLGLRILGPTLRSKEREGFHKLGKNKATIYLNSNPGRNDFLLH